MQRQMEQYPSAFAVQGCFILGDFCDIINKTEQKGTMKQLKNINDRLIGNMAEYEAGVPKRIQHFLKVYEFASYIGHMERLPEKTQRIVETAAIVHDIGIKPSMEKYGSADGKYQEKEGPARAEELLRHLGYAKDVTERVSFLVGHHHTYSNIEGSDYQILVEADFLVNLYEDGCTKEAVQKAYDNIFRTDTGKKLCRTMYGAEDTSVAEDMAVRNPGQ